MELIKGLLGDWGPVGTSRERAETFELFAAVQALKSKDLSIGEVSESVVGGGGDGGIDSLIVLLDGKILNAESDLTSDSRATQRSANKPALELHVVQSKLEASFSETAVQKLDDTLQDFLTLSASPADDSSLYSVELVEKFEVSRQAWITLAGRHVQLSVNIHYATLGDTSSVNPKVLQRFDRLKKQLEEKVPKSSVHLKLLGARELWELQSKVENYTAQLKFSDFTSSDTSYVALVTLENYLDFLSDEVGALREHYFDWNVRDYQKGVNVNQEIVATLEGGLCEDGSASRKSFLEFWWLNNGVTIITSQASIAGKLFSLDDVQIVNGLQTSHSIHETLSRMDRSDPIFQSKILVRVLEIVNDSNVRDKVIRATNRQTPVSDASLRATDDIQRKIEETLKRAGWYYDRRKNYYRNQGEPVRKIVSIPYLAQVVMAIGLGRPDDSRARPSSLLGKDSTYNQVFDPSLDLGAYVWMLERQKEIDSWLSSPTGSVTVSPAERTNYRFHLTYYCAAKLLGQQVRSPKMLATLMKGRDTFSADFIQDSFQELQIIFESYLIDNSVTLEIAAKGRNLVTRINSIIGKLSEGTLES